MANPQDIGSFDLSLTDRLFFVDAPLNSGSTGSFDLSVTDRLDFEDYTEAPAAAVVQNPQPTGTFDQWITDRLTFATVPPKTGDTGSFDQWLTDRLYFQDYVEAATSPPPATQPQFFRSPMWGRF